MAHRATPGRDRLLAPAGILEFSDDLRSADVGPLQDFLAARLGEIARAQPEGTDARWAAEHLAHTIAAACRDLDDALVSWEIELTEGDIHRPGLVQDLRQSLAAGWNRLAGTAQRFAGHPDHLARWRPLRYLSIGHAEFVEQGLGDETDAGILHCADPDHDG
ncbi:hypothetical protein [Streptomyces fuscichromogenes]|uniref:Uncharacterized protein n=1 Tax=Streptomyces fuscichromogenes TaxID=1324013 RepID=A0A917XQA2_9ACTN|nr:hypothetical protein [Streptomyces fuscichromogenes]GGN45843.1 hypothetical protein GCM10011578_098180 [Streptomyces fuscichromogenes]